MIQKTEAIILRCISYKDTSQILTLYTRQYGKISVIAKGIKTKKKTAGTSSSLVGIIIDAVMYVRSTRDIQLITDIQPKKLFFSTHRSLEKLSLLYEVIELVMFCSAQNEINVRMYVLLKTFLHNIEESEELKNQQGLFLRFVLDVLSILGFEINTEKLLFSNTLISDAVKSHKNFIFLAMDGGFTTQDEGMQGRGISREAIIIMLQLKSMDAQAITDMEIDKALLKEIEDVLFLHLETHIEKEYRHKSKTVFSRIQQ